MPLILYRRHFRNCKYHRRSRSDARSQRCHCPVWVQGSLGHEYVRRSLDQTSWEASTDIVRAWQAAGQIPASEPPEPDSPSPAAQDRQPVQDTQAESTPVSVAKAVDEFLADCVARHLKPPTVAKYRTLLKNQLFPFCERESIHDLSSIDLAVLRRFRNGWTFAPITHAKKLENLRSFLAFCVASDWLLRNHALALKPPRIEQKPTLPFEEDEIDRLLDACDDWGARWGGDSNEPRALFLTMRHSGLRVSDAVSLKRTRVQNGRIFLYQQKTGEPVFVPVPPRVIKALGALSSTDDYFFWSGNGKLKTVLESWRRTLLAIAKLANVDDAHFHRFRDSFAVDLLVKGVPIDVAAR